MILTDFKDVVLYTFMAGWLYNLDKSILSRVKQLEKRGRQRISIFLVWLLVLMVQPAAFAVVVDGLFEVEISVPDESKYIRHVALSDGLAEVLVRVSGDRNIVQKVPLPSASAFVKQFRYITIETPEDDHKDSSQVADSTAQVENKYKLWVQYNGTRIMDLLREQSIPIWGEHRSLSVIWFAVNDGSRRYILKDRDFSLLKKESVAAFKRRGIPVVWPKNDSRDRQELSFADIWAGFTEPLQRSSKRYSNGPVISVTMSWNGRAWTGDWSVFIGQESRRWSLNEIEYDALISKGVDLIADTIGKKFAVLEVQDVSKLQQILVKIDRVKSAEGFRQVQSYLMSLPVVQSVKLSQIEPERVAFWLSLRSEPKDFLALVKADTEIIPESNVDTGLNYDVNNPVYHFKMTR